MIYIEAIHMDGGMRHEHIGEVRWRNPQTEETGTSSRAAMVEYIGDGGEAFVRDDYDNTIDVRVVDATPPYIRTHADGTLTDNLLSLPEY